MFFGCTRRVRSSMIIKLCPNHTVIHSNAHTHTHFVSQIEIQCGNLLEQQRHIYIEYVMEIHLFRWMTESVCVRMFLLLCFYFPRTVVDKLCGCVAVDGWVVGWMNCWWWFSMFQTYWYEIHRTWNASSCWNGRQKSHISLENRSFHSHCRTITLTKWRRVCVCERVWGCTIVGMC